MLHHPGYSDRLTQAINGAGKVEIHSEMTDRYRLS